jgi:chromosome segregation ATPase
MIGIAIMEACNALLAEEVAILGWKLILREDELDCVQSEAEALANFAEDLQSQIDEKDLELEWLEDEAIDLRTQVVELNHKLDDITEIMEG